MFDHVFMLDRVLVVHSSGRAVLVFSEFLSNACARKEGETEEKQAHASFEQCSQIAAELQVHAGPVLASEFHPLRPNLIATGGFGEVNIIDISVPPRSFAATMSDMLTFYLSSMHHLASRVPQFLATKF